MFEQLELFIGNLHVRYQRVQVAAKSPPSRPPRVVTTTGITTSGPSVVKARDNVVPMRRVG